MDLQSRAVAFSSSDTGSRSWCVPLEWCADYVGIPFVDGGRDRRGFDCWGLVRVVLFERCGIEIPSYGAIKARDLMMVAREMTMSRNLPPWHAVDTPRAYDVATMFGRTSAGKAICHVGIMVDDSRVLHVENKTDSVVVPLDSFSIKSRLGGFYRHEALL